MPPPEKTELKAPIRPATGLSRQDDQVIVKVMEPAITMEAVERYVEAERARTRKMILWTGMSFLFIAFLILVVFILVSIYAVQTMIKARQEVKTAQELALVTDFRVDAISNTISSISNIVFSVQAGSSQIKEQVEKRDKELQARNRLLKTDLEKFSRWIATKDASSVNTLSSMEQRMLQMEKAMQAKDTELAVIKAQYSVLSTSVAAGVGQPIVVTTVIVNATAPQVAPVYDPGVSEPAPVVPVVAPPANEVEPVAPVEPVAVAVAREEPVDAGSSEEPPDEAAILARVKVAAPQDLSDVRTVAYPDGSNYRGQFKEGLMNGWGRYSYRNGDVYEGEYASDAKNGRGVFTYAGGDVYTGEFRNDIKRGVGIYAYANGDRYVGEFRDDAISGRGTMFYRNGNRYAGEFRNGMKHGRGVFTFANGDVYKGEFKEDLRSGKGVYDFTDGSKYIGDFKDGQRHGEGRYIYRGGEEYTGEFKDGKKHGRGTAIYPDGTRLETIWRDDELIETIDK